MLCSRCNKEIKETDRCCLFCGALNPLHPANQNFNQTLNESFNQVNNQPSVQIENQPSVQIENQTLEEQLPNNNSNNITGIAIFGIINIVYIVLIYLLLKQIPYTVVIGFYSICLELILKKAELPWWGFFIPIFNLYLLSKMAFSSNLLFYLVVFYIILLFVPSLFIKIGLVSLAVLLLKILRLLTYFVFFIIPILFLISLGRKFGVSWIVILFLGFIVVPDIAFSSRYQYYN